MIYVPTQAIQIVNKILSEGNKVIIICPNGVTATAWQKKIKVLESFNPELCKIKMSVDFKHPMIITKDAVLVYPDFMKKKVDK